MGNYMEDASQKGDRAYVDLAKTKDYSVHILENLDTIIYQTQDLNKAFDGIQRNADQQLPVYDIGEFLKKAAGHTGRINTGTGYAALGKRIGILRMLNDDSALRSTLGVDNLWQANIDKIEIFFQGTERLTEHVLSVEEEVISTAQMTIGSKHIEADNKNFINNAIICLGATVINLLQELPNDREENENLATLISNDTQDISVCFVGGDVDEEMIQSANKALERLKTEYLKAKGKLLTNKNQKLTLS